MRVIGLAGTVVRICGGSLRVVPGTIHLGSWGITAKRGLRT